MRIGASSYAVQAAYRTQQASEGEPVSGAYQVDVLKKALDGQSQAAQELLKMLEPKGRVVDIRA
ncbi:MAG: YjfB family protein [Armatimonadetes bacterium]|nr:YjfB family protein [Armatimonadota bacterium]